MRSLVGVRVFKGSPPWMACVRPSFRCSYCLYPPHRAHRVKIRTWFKDQRAGGFVMYAVIRTGGKQYRVAPGDVVKIESVVSENETSSSATCLR